MAIAVSLAHLMPSTFRSSSRIGRRDVGQAPAKARGTAAARPEFLLPDWQLRCRRAGSGFAADPNEPERRRGRGGNPDRCCSARG